MFANQWPNDDQFCITPTAQHNIINLIPKCQDKNNAMKSPANSICCWAFLYCSRNDPSFFRFCGRDDGGGGAGEVLTVGDVAKTEWVNNQ